MQSAGGTAPKGIHFDKVSTSKSKDFLYIEHHGIGKVSTIVEMISSVLTPLALAS